MISKKNIVKVSGLLFFIQINFLVLLANDIPYNSSFDKNVELNPDFPSFNDDHYRARLKELSGEIEYRLTESIKNHIIHRTSKYRAATERTLGLTEMYFPVFEEYLAKKGMPEHLKYLPIVESNLNAVARSHASAVGLWQFISSTGKLYQLKISSYIDERSDTHKATDAATTMLKQLYERYGDWFLALAAYNCGPGRIDKYVKGTKKRYWDIQHMLPKETQLYVPYFSAVVYSYEYHELHNLKPLRVANDLIYTDTIHLSEGYQSLSQLSAKFKINKDTLKYLNPVYIKNYVPSSAKNPILVLPSRIVSRIRNCNDRFLYLNSFQKNNPVKCFRRLKDENHLRLLMRANKCNIDDIRFWNDLDKDHVFKKGELIAIRKYFSVKPVAAKAKRKKSIPIHLVTYKTHGFESGKAKLAPVYYKLPENSAGASQKKSIQAVRSSEPVRIEGEKVFIPSSNVSRSVLNKITKERNRERRLRNASGVKFNNNIYSDQSNDQSYIKTNISKENILADLLKNTHSLYLSESASLKARSYTTVSAEEMNSYKELD